LAGIVTSKIGYLGKIMDQDDLKKQLKKNKPKSKLTVPAEFLDGAKSYDDKLVLVKYLTEKEKNRVLLMIKGMLKDAVKARDRK
jgi:hypothetical protein